MSKILIGVLLALFITVAVSRISYLVLASIIIYVRKRKISNIGITQKHLAIACFIFALYLYTYEGLYPVFRQVTGSDETAIDIMLVLCITTTVMLILFYFVLKNKHLSSLLMLENQKKEYDEKKTVEFSTKVEKLNQLKNEMIELLTPVVQVVNDFEYEGARRLIEEYFEEIRNNTANVNLALDNDVEATINLKIEEAKNRNICIESTISVDKKLPSIFNNDELIFVIANLFDISMLECDNISDSGSLNFSYYTGDSGIFLETEYKNKPLNELLSCSNIESLAQRFLEDTLSRLGGYSTAYNDEGRTKRKVVLPYVGKSYFLKGAGSRS